MDVKGNLLPCPFCGSPAKKTTAMTPQITCSNHKCRLEGNAAFPIEEWNTRPEPEAQEPVAETAKNIVAALYGVGFANSGPRNRIDEAEAIMAVRSVLLASPPQEPAAWAIVAEDGHYRGLYVARDKDHAEAAIYRDKEIFHDSRLAPLFTTPPDDEARRLLADFGVRVLKALEETAPEFLQDELMHRAYEADIFTNQEFDYDDSNPSCGADVCDCEAEPDERTGKVLCCRMNPVIGAFLAPTDGKGE